MKRFLNTECRKFCCGDNMWQQSEGITTLRARREEVKEMKEKRDGGGENEPKDDVKGQNVMCLIWLEWMLWKDTGWNTEPGCHIHPQRVTRSAFETVTKDTKTRQFGNLTKENGQICSPGQLASRNCLHPATNKHERITLCLSDPRLYLLLLLCLCVHRL